MSISASIGGASTGGLLAAICAVVFVMSAIRVGGLALIVRSRRRVSRQIGRSGQGHFDVRVADTRTVLAPSFVVPERLERAIRATGISMDPQKVVLMWIGVVVASGILGAQLGGVPTAVIGALGAVVGGVVLMWANRHRRRDLSDRALPLLLESVARSLRSGASLAQAVVGATSSMADTALADDVSGLTLAIGRGAPLVVAFDQWADRAGSGPRYLTATALSLVAETGGAPGPLVDAVAQTLRDRDQIEREARALSTQSRASAVVIAIAPLAFTAVASMADPNIGTFLFRSPLGLACLLVGLSAEGVGAWWMSHLVGRRR